MPTGYTAGVSDGTITSFREYAMQCARAFGACIMLRDTPLSPEIPEFQPDKYYFDSVKQDEEKLAEFLAMDDVALMTERDAEEQDRVKEAKAGIARNQTTRERYEAMLVKARAFTPPTADHHNYADFLVSQLEESIKFDCLGGYYQEMLDNVGQLTFEQWKSKREAALRSSLDRSRKSLADEIERTNKRNQWVSQLRKAIQEIPE